MGSPSDSLVAEALVLPKAFGSFPSSRDSMFSHLMWVTAASAQAIVSLMLFGARGSWTMYLAFRHLRFCVREKNDGPMKVPLMT